MQRLVYVHAFQEIRTLSIADADDAPRCAYATFQRGGVPVCGGMESTHVVQLGNGAKLNLCRKHAEWYVEIHPVPIVVSERRSEVPDQRMAATRRITGASSGSER